MIWYCPRCGRTKVKLLHKQWKLTSSSDEPYWLKSFKCEFCRLEFQLNDDRKELHVIFNEEGTGSV